MKRFKKVYIEITNVCNLKCEFCPQDNRKPKFMEKDEFGSILDKVKDYTDYVYFHVKGEPLLHPNLDEFLDMAFEKNLKVNLTTNGTLINKKMKMLLSKPSLRQINVSLHSLEQNQWFTNKDSYMDYILQFIDLAKDKELIVALRLWNLSSETNENQEKNSFILEKLKDAFHLDYNLAGEFKKKRGLKIKERLYLNEDVEFIWPSLDNDIYEEKGFCYGLRDQLGILVDGTVVPCCLDSEGVINLGNINEIDLADVLEGSRAKALYDSFSNRTAIEELCKRCGYRAKFGM